MVQNDYYSVQLLLFFLRHPAGKGACPLSFRSKYVDMCIITVRHEW